MLHVALQSKAEELSEKLEACVKEVIQRYDFLGFNNILTTIKDDGSIKFLIVLNIRSVEVTDLCSEDTLDIEVGEDELAMSCEGLRKLIAYLIDVSDEAKQHKEERNKYRTFRAKELKTFGNSLDKLERAVQLYESMENTKDQRKKRAFFTGVKIEVPSESLTNRKHGLGVQFTLREEVVPIDNSTLAVKNLKISSTTKALKDLTIYEIYEEIERQKGWQ